MPPAKRKPANIRHCARNCDLSLTRAQVRYPPRSVVRFSGRDQPWDVGTARHQAALPSVTTCHGTEGTKCLITTAVEQPAIVVTASRCRGSREQDARQRHASSTATRIERIGDPADRRPVCGCVPSVCGRDQRAGGIAHPGAHSRRRSQSHACCLSTASAPTTPRPATSRGSSCSTPISPAGSRWCAGRSRRFGDRKRSAASSRSVATRPASGGTQAFVEGGSRSAAGAARVGRS